MTDLLRNYLKSRKDLINNNNFEKLYEDLKYISHSAICEMTESFLTINIDPADYLQSIPQHYLTNSTSEYAQIFYPEKNLGNLKDIDNNAFMGCVTLEEVLLPETLEYIGVNAFSMCLNLKLLDLPKSLKKIDKFAFQNCMNLRKIRYNGTMEEWKLVNISCKDVFYRVPARKIECIDGELTLRH